MAGRKGGSKEGRYAILVVDMLYDFVHGKLKCARAKRIIPNIKVLLEAARKKGMPVFFLQRLAPRH
jgi:nicotinamidase-related amidase